MSTSKSGIQTSVDGSSYIPASTRADGSTRKEIRIRPGYRPPEDVETYKNRSAEAWKNRGGGGVPGVDAVETTNLDETKSRNAKRREAAKKKKEAEAETDPVAVIGEDDRLSQAMAQASVTEIDKTSNEPGTSADTDAERQKKIRNQLKKLRAVRDLKEKKISGEKLSHDQLMKIGKEEELLRDLRKLNYNGPEMD